MTSLTAIFGNTDEKPEEESEKLLQLYWNRAELKKEFAGLRKEQFRLKDCIKRQEGATALVQHRLDHLEQLLHDPNWVYNVVIHYQLKRLNLRCQSKLEKFAEQLKQQREQRQHAQLLADWNERRSEEALCIESQIGEQRTQVQMLEDQLQAERYRLAHMSGFLKFFRRRSVTAILDNLAASIHSAHDQEDQLLLQYDEIQNRIPPDTQGLSIATKRSINYMILAFAQHLHLHFSDNGLAAMAKEACDKSVGAINYGGKDDCDVIIRRVQNRSESFEVAADSVDILQQRAKLIEEKAQFRGDDDAVPISDSVATLYSIDKKGAIKEQEANLLGENYWNLLGFVCR